MKQQRTPIVAGDMIRVADPTSAMVGFTGIVLEVDVIDSPEAPYVCNVICAFPIRASQVLICALRDRADRSVGLRGDISHARGGILTSS